MNFVKYLRTLFLQKTCGRLRLKTEFLWYNYVFTNRNSFYKVRTNSQMAKYHIY